MISRSSDGRLKIVLGILLFLVILGAGILFYLYQQGSTEHYQPPVAEAPSSKDQVLNDLMAISQAVDAYHAKNLNYPERLEQLQPEFLDKIPLEPKTGKPFVYESDGKSRYRIGLSDPSPYGFKELFVRNGELHKN